MSAAVSQTVTEQKPNEQIVLATTGLEPESAQTIRAAFDTMFAQADEWVARAKEIRVTSVEQRREMKLARESRLALREIRVNAEKARKRLKEDSLRRGKAIDGIANVLKALVEPVEAYLLEQETYADRVETARKEALRDARADALRAYGADPGVYANLGEMSDDTWETTLDTARSAHEARLEAARKAEAVRIEAERIAAENAKKEREEAIRREAERVAREKAQAEENARLRREAAEREESARIEREKAAAEKVRIEAEAQAAREAAEAEARKVREAAEAEARKAREEAARAAAELAALKAAEEKAAREREEAEAARDAAEAEAKRQAELAPDREKLMAFAATLRALSIPTLTTAPGKAAAAKVTDQLTKMIAWVEKVGASL